MSPCVATTIRFPGQLRSVVYPKPFLTRRFRMVTDRHIQRLHRLDQQGWLKGQAAARACIDPKTARKYRQLGQLPSEVRMKHTWRTRLDPFADAWPQVEEQ